jgi:uncharacterized tellurite resistance protein B-like protein
MFESFRGMLTALSEKGASKFGPADYRLAAAALMAHVAGVDGIVTDSEAASLRRALSSGFGLSRRDAETLAAAGSRGDREAGGIHEFVEVVKTALDTDGRLRIVEMMYEIGFADGVLVELESDLIERVAEELDLSPADVATIKRLAAAGKASQ